MDPGVEAELRAATAGVAAAFAGAAAPAPDRWVLPQRRPNDQAAAHENAAKFAAASPHGLDEAFWAERWASLCYCTVEGYRYLLPSLLRCAASSALRATPDESRLWSSTVYGLRPSSWHLYWEGRDESFDERLRSLNAQQRSAVAAWLGATMLSPSQEHNAAHALVWGWNEPATPALERARGFYRRMTSHRWPEPQEPRRRQLIAAVREAFSAAPAPRASDMTDSAQGDEPAEYALEFRAVDRWTLHPDFISRNSAALSFFSEASFRYFLPAFVIADIHGLAGNGDPVFLLTDSLADAGSDKHEWRVERLSVLARAEREALATYLEWRAEGSEFDRKAIEPALAAFWKRR